LKWKEIYFDYEDIGLIRFFRTKNKRERTEYLMPRTKHVLTEWRDHQEWMRKRKKIKSNGKGFVFCWLDGRPIKRFDTAWRRVCKIAGFEGLHFHDLRHTFCSNLILSGGSLKDAKEMIGHGLHNMIGCKKTGEKR
jgi:integrase